MIDKEAIRRLPEMEADQVFETLETSPAGLTAAEAHRRIRQYGKNELPKPVPRSLWRLLFDQLTHFMALLLWVAGAMAFAVDMPELGYASVTVILINAVFSFWQEYRAERVLSKLTELLPRKITLFRAGKLVIAPAKDVVPGDVLFIEAGDHVPADARLIEAEELSVDLSLLTGESLPAERDAEAITGGQPVIRSTNVVLAGTTAATGRGIAVVYATGKQTEFGKVARLTAGVGREKSTLELQVQRIVRIITSIALLMGLTVFTLAVWWMGLDVRESFIFCIGIIIANVPEGLLPTVSLSLAIGVQRMARQNALVRRLSAVETLCATTVICTDKTGTLTLNEVTVRRIWVPGGNIEVSGAGYEKNGEVLVANPELARQVNLLLTLGVVCSDADIVDDEKNQDTWKTIGDPTEAALLVAAAKGGQSSDEVRGMFIQQLVVPFNSQRRMMTTIEVNRSSSLFPKDETLTMVKGAPPEVLHNCRYWLQADGLIELSDLERSQVNEVNDALAREGHRVLAMAYRTGDVLQPPEQELVLVGLVAMIDPPRPDVAEAIMSCRQAGVRVTMITGDYGLTAEAIGRQIGLMQEEVFVLTGDEFEAIGESEQQELLRQDIPIIFARATPGHKLKIVETYKVLGDIVAVTGDGVNDAPALKAAHVGIAMGRGGTDVAREAADIVLLDDHFATIAKAIEQGRAIYDNIRKFMTYILASNIPEIVPFVAMVFAKIPPALNIMQILAIDLGTDMLPALALGAEKPEKGVMGRKPSDYSGNLLDRALLLRAYGFLGIIEAVLSMGGFLAVWFQSGYTFTDIQQVTTQILYNTADETTRNIYLRATTMALASIIACQVGNLFVCRSEYLPFWKMSYRDIQLLLTGIVTEISLLMAIIYLPFLTAIFLTRPLTLQDLAWLVLCPVILVILEEFRRYFAAKF